MRLTAIVFALGLGTLSACDGEGTEPGGGGSSTQCDLNFSAPNDALKDFGEGCESDSECAFAECVMPGTGGNITNKAFGFCSRGCDCEDNVNARLSVEQKEVLDCLYPAGFKDFHHVVVECSSLGDCTALDPRWTDCRLAESGNARKVCHAD